MAAGTSCLANVSFDPAALPSAQSGRSATMTISYGGAGSQLAVPLSGTATQAGVSFNLTGINFGNQLAGTAGLPQGIQATNGGTGALVISKIVITGANPSDFNETDTCVGPVGSPINVPPNGTCGVQIVLQPPMPTACGTAAGPRTATLTLTDNAPGSPHTFPLSGTETDYCLIPQAGTTPGSISAGVPASYDIASYPVGSLNAFSGLISLTCTGFPAGGSCAPAPPSMTVAAGSAAPFQVNVTAGSALLPNSRPKTTNRFPPNNPWRLAAICVAFAICLASTWLMGPAPTHASGFRRCVQASALFTIFAVGIAACGGGSSGADPPPIPQTYTLALAGTSSCPAASVCSTPPTRQVQLTLTVP